MSNKDKVLGALQNKVYVFEYILNINNFVKFYQVFLLSKNGIVATKDYKIALNKLNNNTFLKANKYVITTQKYDPNKHILIENHKDL